MWTKDGWRDPAPLYEIGAPLRAKGVTPTELVRIVNALKLSTIALLNERSLHIQEIFPGAAIE